MTGADVLQILDLLAAAGIPTWIGGGWGVDALAGHQTRDHEDLDLVFDRSLEARVVELLAGDGLEETLDRRPGRFVMSDSTRQVDLHPLEFLADGSAVLHTHDGGRFDYPPGSFTTGTIDGREVPCITAARQREFHHGYEPAGKDRHDLGVLQRLPANEGTDGAEGGSLH